MIICDFCDDYNYGIKQVAGNNDYEYGIKQAGNDDYDYDEGRYLFFSTRCSREKNLLIPAAAGSFSPDASLGLLATRRRLGRRGNLFCHALSFCGVSCMYEEFHTKKENSCRCVPLSFWRYPSPCPPRRRSWSEKAKHSSSRWRSAMDGACEPPRVEPPCRLHDSPEPPPPRQQSSSSTFMTRSRSNPMRPSAT